MLSLSVEWIQFTLNVAATQENGTAMQCVSLFSYKANSGKNIILYMNIFKSIIQEEQEEDDD